MTEDAPASSTPDKPKGFKLIAGIVATAIALSAAGYAALRPRAAPEPHRPSALSDSGNAPAEEPTGYIDLQGAPSPAATGRFFNTALDGGPLHLDGGAITLGTTAGRSARDIPETRQDDGLVIASGWQQPGSAAVTTGMMPCASNRILAVLDLSRLPEGARKGDAVINAYFDWDRNGLFGGSDGCADEWAVKNQRVGLADKRPISGIPVPLAVDAGRQALDFWYRVTVTLDDEMSLEAPEAPLKYGETEDAHYLDPSLVAQAQGRGQTAAAAAPPAPITTTRTPQASPSPAKTGAQAGAASPALSATGTGARSPDALQTCDTAPDQTVLWSATVLLPIAQGTPGTSMKVESASASPVGNDGSRSAAKGLKENPGTAGAGPSAWLELDTSPDGGARRGRVDFTLDGSRKACFFWQLPAEVGGAPPVGVTADPRVPSGARPATSDDLGRLRCPERRLLAGEETSAGLSDFGAAPGLDIKASVMGDLSPTASGMKIGVKVPATVSEPEAEVVYAYPSGAAAGKDAAGSVTCRVLLAPGSSPRVQYRPPATPGGATATSGPGGRETTTEGPAPPSSGAYKVRFMKKSDSCGTFPPKEDDRLSVRLYDKTLEISRPASGMHSQGPLRPDYSFQATGSGSKKDGSQYAESYQGAFKGDTVMGDYEIQQGECRATFTFEGTRL